MVDEERKNLSIALQVKSLLERALELKTSCEKFSFFHSNLSWTDLLDRFSFVLGQYFKLQEALRQTTSLSDLLIYPGIVSNESNPELEQLTSQRLLHLEPEIISNVLLRTKLIPEVDSLKQTFSMPDQAAASQTAALNSICTTLCSYCEKLRDEYGFTLMDSQPQEKSEIINRTKTLASAVMHGSSGIRTSSNGLPFYHHLLKPNTVGASVDSKEGGLQPSETTNVAIHSGGEFKKQDILIREMQTEISEQAFANIKLSSVDELRRFMNDDVKDLEKRLIQELLILQKAEHRLRSEPRLDSVMIPEEQRYLSLLQSERRILLREHYENQRKDILQSVEAKFQEKFQQKFQST
eukprot:Sdes_comp20769_c0_seq2m16789